MRVLAIRHVEIEDLGMMEDIFREKKWSFEYLDTPKGKKLGRPIEEYSLVVLLGGYMGAYEEEKYPFLKYEFQLIEEALRKEIPFLGICLGSQMLARVLGANVYRGKNGEEIGWFFVEKVSDDNLFSDFPDRLLVFQWHGDTFDLPHVATKVFTSEKYENQGFVYRKAVGLQFHIEVGSRTMKRWIEAYRRELKEKNIDPKVLLETAEKEEKTLKDLLKSLLERMVES
ncbi:type 1 glutamine amidotransferase [Thermotoga sp. SG1]|uniref:type 1 glutamine amidotransferase n=1 Tax=Thermotoga sp. SG1 TaxID=126739 RepID=UPI000C75AFB8|nr:type 1 glutamine amidotransferase [Thermotoga sp. SG1]PLV56186.1 glutamine amidotransferase [Thermotoga sp. SG1]